MVGALGTWLMVGGYSKGVRVSAPVLRVLEQKRLGPPRQTVGHGEASGKPGMVHCHLGGDG